MIRIKHFIYLVVVMLMASCLPQEKTTQCGANEAFDAGKRACVATASTASVKISSVTPSNSYTISTGDTSKTHAVSVSDPYGAGFQLKWNLTQPSGSVILLGTSSSLTFNHTAFVAGSYIIEVQLLSASGTIVYDSRSWTVNVTTDTTPSINPDTPTPLTTTTSSAARNISATVANPDNILSVQYEWFVNGAAVAGESGGFSTSSQVLSFSFDSTDSSSYFAGAGVYAVQLVLSENSSGLTYDTFNWTITNNIPNFASVSTSTSSLYSTATPNGSSLISSLDGINIATSGFLSDVDADNIKDPIDFCFSVDDIGGVESDGVYVDFLLDGAVIPGISFATGNNQFTSNNGALCLGDIVPTFDIDLVDANIVESHNLTAVIYDGYTGPTNRAKYNGMTEIERVTWQLRVRPANTAPSIEIDFANTTDTAGQLLCASKTSSSFSDCAIQYGVPFDVAITVSDDDYNPVQFTGEYANFKVEFFLEDELLDGGVAPTATNSDSDCFEDFSETASASRYICTVTINNYNSTGAAVAATSSYTLKAKVTDDSSPYAAATPTESNIVSWSIEAGNVTDNNSAPSVNEMAQNDADKTGDVTGTKSWVSTVSTPGTALSFTNLGVVTENDLIQFHIQIDEPDRDNHTITIFRCNDAACSSLVIPAVQTVAVTTTSATNPIVTVINHQISQEAVTGTNQTDVFYGVFVSDGVETDASNDDDLDLILDNVVKLSTNNFNPSPVFATANFNPAVPANLVAFTGFPLTIDVGSVTDSSLADGDEILYQWQYSVNAGGTWTNIDGATEKNLIWTPGHELQYNDPTGTGTGTPVKLKLCLGDDGTNTGGTARLADCADQTLDTTYDGVGGLDNTLAWDVTVFSNMTQSHEYLDNSAANTSNGLVATWVDPSSVDPVVTYSAYVNTNNEIIVDKIVTAKDGTKGGSIEQTTEELAAITFPASTDVSFSTNDITHLSMAGDTVNGALYIAYMTPVSSVDEVHVKRIDISLGGSGLGKTGFKHPGKFGWDIGYNTLSDNITILGGGMDPLIINANGQAELSLNNDADSVAMSVQFGSLSGGTSTITSGTGIFCNPTSSCTTAALTATSLAAAINASTSKELQGLTATASANIVTFEGIVENDFIEGGTGATKIGSIMVNQTNGKWQLPFIDVTQAGVNKFKISVMEGDLGVRLVNSNSITRLLPTTIASIDLANDLDANDTMILATKDLTSGEIAAYEIDDTYTILESDTDLFSDPDITDLKVSVSKEDTDFEPSAFIVGLNTDGRIAFSRIDSTAGNFDIANATTSTELDAGFTLIDGITNFDITAGPIANQLIMAIVADDDGDTDFESYIINIKGATPTASCSYDSGDLQNGTKCTQLNTESADKSFNLNIALGDVLRDVTIGDAGATASENIGDLVPVIFHIDDGGGAIATDAKVVNGLLNVKATSLTTSETNSGDGHITPYVAP